MNLRDLSDEDRKKLAEIFRGISDTLRELRETLEETREIQSRRIELLKQI